MYVMRKLSKGILIIYIVCILFPLILGASYYILFENTSYINMLFSKYVVDFSLMPEKNKLYLFCNNYLCDICWSFSLESAVLLIMYDTKWRYIISLCISIAFSTALELLQLFNIFSGVFDLHDILYEAIAILIACAIIYYSSRRYKG